MRQNFISLLVLFFVLPNQLMAFSQKTTLPSSLRWEFYPLSYQSRFEQGENQQTVGRHAVNIAFGGSMGSWGMLLDYSRFEVQSGTSYARISRRHEETMLWLRREWKKSPPFYLMAAAGSGFSKELVQTHFGSESVQDPGRNDVLGALSVGSGIELKKTFRLSLEGRLFFGGSTEPGVQTDILIRSGILF